MNAVKDAGRAGMCCFVRCTSRSRACVYVSYENTMTENVDVCFQFGNAEM